MTRKLVPVLCSLLLLFAAHAHAADVRSDQIPNPAKPMTYTFIGGISTNNGAWLPVLIDPISGGVVTAPPDYAASQFIGGISADTTIKVGAGAFPAWQDTDPAPFTAANRYPNKHFWFKVDSNGSATVGRIIVRFQASITGAVGEWFNVYYTRLDPAGASVIDTLQLNLDRNGAPFGTIGGIISLNNFTAGTSGGGDPMTQAVNPLNGYPFVRALVINRTDSSATGGSITTSQKWQGGQ